MVMTQRQAPKLSIAGMALALSLAIAAWAATPARSAEQARRPGPDSTGPVAPIPPVPPIRPVPPVAPVAPIPAIAPLPPVPPIGPMAWGVASKPPHGPGAEPDHGDIERRLERLERRLERLAERLERVSHPARRSGESAGHRAQRRRGRPHGRGTGAPSFTQAPVPRREIVRTYRLPRGQLEAITKLMVRSDVPIRVRPTDNGIEVHGSAEQHARFRAFVEMLSGKDSVVAYRLPAGKLKDLTELMGRDDVPIMVEPGDEAIKVHGSPAVQAVFRGFVELINPPKGGSVGRRGALHLYSPSPAEAKQVARWLARTEALQDLTQKQLLRELSVEMAERQGKVSRKMREVQRIVEKQIASRQPTTTVQAELRRAMKQLSQHAKQLEKQAEQLEEQADKLEKEADGLRDKANDLRERSKESDKPEKAVRLRIKAALYEAQAGALESLKERLLTQAESLQDQADAVEAKADEMGEKIEAQLEKAKASAEDHREIDEDDDGGHDDHHDGDDDDNDDDDDD